MKKSGPPLKTARKVSSGSVLGRDRFAKISAVEGIVLTRDMIRRAADFDRQGLSAEERRQSIVRVYRKG